MALTVVIIYKTTGHLNFAQGEMGALGAFLVYVFAIEHGWPYVAAIVLAVGLSMALGCGMERTLIRPIERRSALGVVIVTLGVFLILNSLNAVDLGHEPADAGDAVPPRSHRPVRAGRGPTPLRRHLRHDRHLDRAGRGRRRAVALLPEDEARARLPGRGRQP